MRMKWWFLGVWYVDYHDGVICRLLSKIVVCETIVFCLLWMIVDVEYVDDSCWTWLVELYGCK